MVWRIDDPAGNESAKIKFEIVQYTRGKGIDVGCGPTKLFRHFIGIDSCKDTELFNIEMKPDVVCEDAADLNFIDDNSLDFVFSSHLLEHLEDTGKALAEWWKKLKVGGHLVLYLPHFDLYPRMGVYGSNPDHKHDFRESDIRTHMESVGGWTLIREEVRDQAMEYSFLQVFKKRGDSLCIVDLETRPDKAACVVRYGGFGDSLQSANLLPELKRQGYHVSFMTTPRGQEILKHDPHIDTFLLQDDDQVENNELVLYWAVQKQKFDKWIQLSESVEGTLLAFPGRTNHGWPVSVRRKEMNKNYLEWTADLAELPYRSEARFYPSPEETQKAKQYLADFKNKLAGPIQMLAPSVPKRFNILWCLAGSSIHKFYPGQDDVIANILQTMPEAVIIFSGDMACKILEAGWEEEPRIRCESGEMGIRDTLTLAQNVDCVVGPETGVLNAVALSPWAR
jgi:ADP-heptose:LPS heptosyltransferase/predicted SAM-dependent methyltransferase